MKNPRAFLVALIVAFLATLAQCKYIDEREKELLELAELIPTVVAIKKIPPDFRLDETMVEVIEIPRKWRQPMALSAPEDVLGQIAGMPFHEGEQIMSHKLLHPDDAGLAYYVNHKFRAVAVAVDPITAVGGHLMPGNYVDVLGSFDFGAGEKSDMRTVTLLQNVEVLSVGEVLDQGRAVSAEEIDEPRDLRSGIHKGGSTVTLQVTPEEAQKLILAQELGALALTLRSLWEQERSVKLDHATIHNTLGIPQRVRYKTRPKYSMIRSGGL